MISERTSDRVLRVRALVGNRDNFVVRSWARHFSFKVPLFAQGQKWTLFWHLD